MKIQTFSVNIIKLKIAPLQLATLKYSDIL
jgi:hypothetical protein